MKGCARTCLLWLFGVAAAAVAFYVYLRQFGEFRSQIYWASGIAGFVVALALGYAYNIVTLSKERKMLLDAMVGTPLVDGKWVAVSGVIRALSPLQTPITNTSAVAYEYDMYRMERVGKSATKVSYWDGKALTPSTISTRQGAVKLLAVPTLDLPAIEEASEEAFANAERYVNHTTFQTRSMPKEQRIGVAEESTDDDGAFRVDRREEPKLPLTVRDCYLQEKLVKQGETVCAFGLYSAARGGIIPHPNWAQPMRLMRGDAATGASQLRSRIIKYAIAIVCCLGVAYGAAKVYERYAKAETAKQVGEAPARTPALRHFS